MYDHHIPSQAFLGLHVCTSCTQDYLWNSGNGICWKALFSFSSDGIIGTHFNLMKGNLRRAAPFSFVLLWTWCLAPETFRFACKVHEITPNIYRVREQERQSFDMKTIIHGSIINRISKLTVDSPNLRFSSHYNPWEPSLALLLCISSIEHFWQSSWNCICSKLNVCE